MLTLQYKQFMVHYAISRDGNQSVCSNLAITTVWQIFRTANTSSWMYVASLKADSAIASKTVILSSLEILDDFQNVSMKIKVLKV